MCWKRSLRARVAPAMPNSAVRVLMQGMMRGVLASLAGSAAIFMTYALLALVRHCSPSEYKCNAVMLCGPLAMITTVTMGRERFSL